MGELESKRKTLYKATNKSNNIVNMRIFILSCIVSSVFTAPQFVNENKNVGENCHTEISTVFEEVGSQSVNKVVCETEFRDNCVTLVQNICKNVTTGDLVCKEVDRLECTDTITTKCGQEKVLRNVSYTENVCNTVMEDICEKETVDGVVRSVEGSCVSKPVGQCVPETRFQEEFVDEEVCRDIPIKDCESVKENVCNDQQEDVETEKCEVVPHEECKQVIQGEPVRISKKVFTTVCDDDKANMEIEDDYDVPDLKDILAIFGVTNSENEIPNDVEDDTQSATPTTTTSITTASTTTTTRTTTSTSTATTSTTAFRAP